MVKKNLEHRVPESINCDTQECQGKERRLQYAGQDIGSKEAYVCMRCGKVYFNQNGK